MIITIFVNNEREEKICYSDKILFVYLVCLFVIVIVNLLHFPNCRHYGPDTQKTGILNPKGLFLKSSNWGTFQVIPQACIFGSEEHWTFNKLSTGLGKPVPDELIKAHNAQT